MEPAPVLTDQRPTVPIADAATELRQLLSAIYSARQIWRADKMYRRPAFP